MDGALYLADGVAVDRAIVQLAGVALGSFFSSITALLLIRGQGTFETFQMLGWLMGSLARADWGTLLLVAPYVLLPILIAVPLGRWMNQAGAPLAASIQIAVDPDASGPAIGLAHRRAE